MVNEAYRPVSDAIKRFNNFAHNEGVDVTAWPLSNPSFRIERFDADGDFVSLIGIDGSGQPSVMVVPLAQLSFQMSLEPNAASKGAVGFIQSVSDTP